MGISKLQCPNCGASVRPIEGKRLFDCARCGSITEHNDIALGCWKLQFAATSWTAPRIRSMTTRRIPRLACAGYWGSMVFLDCGLSCGYNSLKEMPGSDQGG